MQPYSIDTTIPCAHCGAAIAFSEPGYRRFCSQACRYASRSESVEARFWRHVAKTVGCWTWQGAHFRQGYGQFRDHRLNTAYAHRIAYEITHGPVPDGLHVLHRCDNPPCVRPDHLFLGTIAENQKDMVNKGRSTRGRVRPDCAGERNARAKLSAAQVAEVRRRYAAGGRTSQSLAREYGVGKSQVLRIVRGEAWH